MHVYLPFLYQFMIDVGLHTVFSRLNAGGVYLKLGLVDPALNRGPAFIYAVHFSTFSSYSFFYQQYWGFVELRTKFQQNVKNI